MAVTTVCGGAGIRLAGHGRVAARAGDPPLKKGPKWPRCQRNAQTRTRVRVRELPGRGQ